MPKNNRSGGTASAAEMKKIKDELKSGTDAQKAAAQNILDMQKAESGVSMHDSEKKKVNAFIKSFKSVK